MKFPIITTLLALTILGCKSEAQREVSTSDSDFRNAVRNGKVEQVERYLKDGYEIDRLGMGGENALQEGVLHYEVAKLLIKNGISVNQQHKYDGTTPLIVAAMAGNIETRTVKLLLDSGADPRIKDAHGKTAIDHAADNAAKFPNPKYGFAEKLHLLRTAAEKVDSGQSSNAPQSKSEDDEKPKPDAELLPQ